MKQLFQRVLGGQPQEQIPQGVVPQMPLPMMMQPQAPQFDAYGQQQTGLVQALLNGIRGQYGRA